MIYQPSDFDFCRVYQEAASNVFSFDPRRATAFPNPIPIG